MNPEDQKKVNDERVRLGLDRNRNKPTYKGKQNRNSANTSNHLTQLKAANTNYKRTIDSLKSIYSEDTPSDDDVEMFDAGNVFGGKAKKAKK